MLLSFIQEFNEAVAADNEPEVVKDLAPGDKPGVPTPSKKPLRKKAK